MKSCVGLTGPIGSGKSHILRGLQEAGLATLDCDLVVRELLWGDSPDSQLLHADIRSASKMTHVSRDALRNWLLKGESERQILERLIHPHVVAVVEEQCKKILAGELLVVEGTRLAESGLLPRLEAVLVVDAAKSLRQERALKRGGLTPQDFERLDRIQDYSKLEHKRLARFVNDRSTDFVVKEVIQVLQTWGLM